VSLTSHHITDRRVREDEDDFALESGGRYINLVNEEYIGMCRREVLDGFMRNRSEAVQT